ncbi:unnamed protein product [Didymodactylos carnosus]|uniref:Uncharacterized protein n=1 Tax=Didymodactylos carnosus TaxID=1234261 RepID=A0A815WRV1_9BILA|nr:unnamed protein product [Didymodactylos carnosus]CAF4412292.1 unnamed protein product [Didymodactylos carnosus]
METRNVGINPRLPPPSMNITKELMIKEARENMKMNVEEYNFAFCGLRRARYNGVMYEMYQDHICQAPDPNEIEKAVFNHEIRQQAEQCHDPRKPSRRT